MNNILVKAQKIQLAFIFQAILLTIFFTTISSCGIPTVTLFESAQITTDVGKKTITITHNSTNDNIQSAQFLGYEIYYKLYKESNTTTRASDKNYITDTVARIPSPSVLTTKNFLKIKTINFNIQEKKFNDITDTPTISIADNNSTIILDFGISSPSEYTYTSGSGNLYGYQALLINQNNSTEILQRNLNTNTKSFFNTISEKSFNSSDYDIRKMISSFNDDTLELIIAIIPYGVNLSNIQVLYGNIAISEDITLNYGQIPN